MVGVSSLWSYEIPPSYGSHASWIPVPPSSDVSYDSHVSHALDPPSDACGGR